MTTQTLHLIDEYLTQGGYTPGIDAETLDREAHLIAAAPDLLAALHDADEFCQQGLNSPEPVHWEAALQDIMGLVRAAINKAKGN